MDNTRWYGTVNVNNLEDVAKAIYNKLVGKRYVFASFNDYYNYPNVIKTRVNQQIEGDLQVWNKGDYAGFNIGDSYGVWGLSTWRQEEGYDGNFDSPYVSFEWDTITITHRAPADNILVWQITVLEEN